MAGDAVEHGGKALRLVDLFLDSALITIFCMASWLMGTDAMRAASASTSASSWSSGTDFSTSPISAASTPVILSPVNIMRLAFSGPSRCTHIAVVGQPQTRVGM